MDRKLRRTAGTVQELLEKEMTGALGDRIFRLLVIKPLKIDTISSLDVSKPSNGEMQRLAITLCLARPAQFYLIDEPSAGLDCEQRVVAAKVMKSWVVSHLGKSIVLVEHDLAMAASMADRVVVYDGTPGQECYARAPVSAVEGLNSFLEILDVAIRHDPENFRPRINKKNCLVDKERRKAGQVYKLHETMEAAEESKKVRVIIRRLVRNSIDLRSPMVLKRLVRDI